MSDISELPILYSFRRCPYAMRARLAVAVSGQRCELREVVLRNKPQELLQASPKATVPVLVLPDGGVLEQSLDIMLWALRLHDPEGWLTPEEGGLSVMLDLIEECDERFKPKLDRYKYPGRFTSELVRPEAANSVSRAPVVTRGSDQGSSDAVAAADENKESSRISQGSQSGQSGQSSQSSQSSPNEQTGQISQISEASQTGEDSQASQINQSSEVTDAQLAEWSVAQRDAGGEWLASLEARLATHTWLFGSRRSLADMAIAPFVRQYAHVDKAWFEAQPWPQLQAWLKAWMESDLFASVMTKYRPWTPDTTGEIFP